jgi:hypothetical protein
MGTTAPVNKDSGACLLRSPFVQVKNFDDMPTASFVNEKYALIVETDKGNGWNGLPGTT